MKVIKSIILITVFSITACASSDNSGDDSSGSISNPAAKEDMREFVQGISSYAKNINTTFVVIPQNGQEILTVNGESNGAIATDYINAIDGVGREDLLYGYNNDDEATPSSEINYMKEYLAIAENNGVEVLVIDYCWTASKMDNSYFSNETSGYISFAADHRGLDNIPSYPANPYNVNTADISNLSQAKNFLYIIDTSGYVSKEAFLTALENTNYDVLVIDLLYEDIQLTSTDIDRINNKSTGQPRLVLCYMSIGEAENYRYYWQSGWNSNPPSWLVEENPDWPGNYKVKYWDSNWQSIIFGNDSSYLKKILDAGFDGVYLDIIDAFEYFE